MILSGKTTIPCIDENPDPDRKKNNPPQICQILLRRINKVNENVDRIDQNFEKEDEQTKCKKKKNFLKDLEKEKRTLFEIRRDVQKYGCENLNTRIESIQKNISKLQKKIYDFCCYETIFHKPGYIANHNQHFSVTNPRYNIYNKDFIVTLTVRPRQRDCTLLSLHAQKHKYYSFRIYLWKDGKIQIIVADNGLHSYGLIMRETINIYDGKSHRIKLDSRKNGNTRLFVDGQLDTQARTPEVFSCLDTILIGAELYNYKIHSATKCDYRNIIIKVKQSNPEGKDNEIQGEKG